MSQLLTVPIEKVRPNPDNPRGKIDETSETFKGFVATIKRKGLLQPLLVGLPDEDGIYTVIAGGRRYAGAVKAKLTEVPAMVVDADGAELTLALIENVQREDLSPVAEARAIRQLREKLGLTQVEAAQTLSKSERWARERERLCDLPDKVQEAFDAKAIPLEATGDIAEIAEKSPRAASALAARVLVQAEGDDGENGTETVRRNLADRRDLGIALEEAIEDAPNTETSAAHFLYEAGGGVDLGELERANVPEPFLVQLRDGFQELKRLRSWARVEWTEEALDQARAFGCLLELEVPDRYDPDWTTTRRYITDATWLGENALVLLNVERAEVKKEVERQKGAGAGVDKAEKGSDAEKREKERKRKAREAEFDHREQVRVLNLELGQRSEKAFRGSKLFLEEQKLIALMAVGGEASDLGARGLIYSYHDYQEVEQLKNGRTKVTYSTGRTAGDDLIKAILEAKRDGEPLAIAIRALLLAANADQTCLAESNRSWWQVPGAGAADQVKALLAQITDAREILPESIRKANEEKARIRGEKVEMMILLAIKGSRAKEGIKHDQLIGESRVITAAAIDEALDRKWIKAHEAGELSYTITESGKKRLEKLKAAEDARENAAKGGAGLSAEHNDVLERIRKEPGIAASRLSKDSGVKQNALYRLVGDLEKAGLVVKKGRKYTAVEAAKA